MLEGVEKRVRWGKVKRRRKGEIRGEGSAYIEKGKSLRAWVLGASAITLRPNKVMQS